MEMEAGRFRHFWAAETSEISLQMLPSCHICLHTRERNGNLTTNIGGINLWNLIFIKFYRSLDTVGCSEPAGLSKITSLCWRNICDMMMWLLIFEGRQNAMWTTKGKSEKLTLPATSFLGSRICVLSVFELSSRLFPSSDVHIIRIRLCCAHEMREQLAFVSFETFHISPPLSLISTLVSANSHPPQHTHVILFHFKPGIVVKRQVAQMRKLFWHLS